MRRSTLLAVCFGLALLAGSVSREAAAGCSDPVLLDLHKDALAGNPHLSWNDIECPCLVDRSTDPEFPGGLTDSFEPDAGPDGTEYTDPAAPTGLVFYRVRPSASDPFQEECDRSDRDPSQRFPVTLKHHTTERVGYFNTLNPGDIEATKFVFDDPVILKSIRIWFTGQPGDVEIYLWSDYSGSWPDESDELIPPIVTTVTDTGSMQVFDISSHDVRLAPRQKFWVGYKHVNRNPYVWVDDGLSPSHCRIKIMPSPQPPYVWFGLQDEANFWMEVQAEEFCPLNHPIFDDRSLDVGLDAYTDQRVAWGDANGDRYDDLLIGGNKLLVNDQAGGFDDMTASSGVDGWSNAFGAFADVDNDGDEDLYMAVYTNQDPPPQSGDPQDVILLNDGSGVYAPLVPSGVEEFSTTSGAAFGDYDADGFLDLYVGNWLEQYPQIPSMKDFLFKGNGDGTFSDVTTAAGLGNQGSVNMPCYGVAWSDYDNDGDLDIFVGNYGRQPNFLWQNQHNQGSDSFNNVAAAVNLDQDDIGPGGGNTFGEDWGDFDNDGDMDLALAEIAHPRYQPTSDISSVQVNSGAPDFVFTDEREARGVGYDEGGMEASWADFDNDGDLDLLISNLYALHYAALYRQESDGSFTDVTHISGVHVHDSTNHAWADYDRDGDLDLAITNRGVAPHVWLFENLEGNRNNWLTVRLEGTDCNRDGIGARVFVTSGGLTQIREVKGSKGHFSSQPSMAVEFGLGQRMVIDELRVRWPCGSMEVYTGAEINRFLLVREGEVQVVFE